MTMVTAYVTGQLVALVSEMIPTGGSGQDERCVDR